MEIEVCSSFEPETELGVTTSATAPSLLDRLRCPAWSELARSRKTFYVVEFSAFKMLYHASTMLNDFGFYNAQNYAGIIHQGLLFTLICNVLKRVVLLLFFLIWNPDWLVFLVLVIAQSEVMIEGVHMTTGGD